MSVLDLGAPAGPSPHTAALNCSKECVKATANLLPTEVAAHECIEHFTLPGTARSNPPGNLSAHSVPVTPRPVAAGRSGTRATAGIIGAYVHVVTDYAARAARQHISTATARRAAR